MMSTHNDIQCINKCMVNINHEMYMYLLDNSCSIPITIRYKEFREINVAEKMSIPHNLLNENKTLNYIYTHSYYSNYHHFCSEIIPSILVMKSNNNYEFIFSMELNDWQKDIVSRLDINYCTIKKNVVYDKLYYINLDSILKIYVRYDHIFKNSIWDKSTGILSRILYLSYKSIPKKGNLLNGHIMDEWVNKMEIHKINMENMIYLKQKFDILSNFEIIIIDMSAFLINFYVLPKLPNIKTIIIIEGRYSMLDVHKHSLKDYKYHIIYPQKYKRNDSDCYDYNLSEKNFEIMENIINSS